jgi:hypothetical protein
MVSAEPSHKVAGTASGSKDRKEKDIDEYDWPEENGKAQLEDI